MCEFSNADTFLRNALYHLQHTTSSGGYANSPHSRRMLKEEQWSASSKKPAPIESPPKYPDIRNWPTEEFGISCPWRLALCVSPSAYLRCLKSVPISVWCTNQRTLVQPFQNAPPRRHVLIGVPWYSPVKMTSGGVMYHLAYPGTKNTVIYLCYSNCVIFEVVHACKEAYSFCFCFFNFVASQLYIVSGFNLLWRHQITGWHNCAGARFKMNGNNQYYLSLLK